MLPNSLAAQGARRGQPTRRSAGRRDDARGGRADGGRPAVRLTGLNVFAFVVLVSPREPSFVQMVGQCYRGNAGDNATGSRQPHMTKNYARRVLRQRARVVSNEGSYLRRGSQRLLSSFASGQRWGSTMSIKGSSAFLGLVVAALSIPIARAAAATCLSARIVDLQTRLKCQARQSKRFRKHCAEEPGW